MHVHAANTVKGRPHWDDQPIHPGWPAKWSWSARIMLSSSINFLAVSSKDDDQLQAERADHPRADAP